MIRPAVYDDADAIAAVYCFSWKEGYKGILPSVYLDSLTVESNTPKNFNPSNYLVSETDGKVTGIVNCGSPREESEAGTGELRAIYVMPDHWHSGIGTSLFKAASEALKNAGYTSFYLWTLKDNVRARRFYEKMGMKSQRYIMETLLEED